MLTVHVRLVLPRPEDLPFGNVTPSKSYVRHYTEIPWPRVPVVGEFVWLVAPNIIAESEVPVAEVLFHSNGNVFVGSGKSKLRPMYLNSSRS